MTGISSTRQPGSCRDGGFGLLHVLTKPQPATQQEHPDKTPQAFVSHDQRWAKRVWQLFPNVNELTVIPGAVGLNTTV
jgi:hypothetical protein